MLPIGLLALISLATAGVVKRQASFGSDAPRLDGNPSKLKSACREVGLKNAPVSQWDPGFGSTLGKNDPTVVPASIALDCLQSVELDVKNDVALIDYLTPILDWQSTIGYHKNPPAGYLIPGVDILGGLAEIKKKLQDKKYANQFQFVVELYSFLVAVGDGHLSYLPGLLSAFMFMRGLELVSVSSDGIQLPKVYDAADLAKSKRQAGYTPSAIVEINGERIEDVLSKRLTDEPSHDPDTRYNSNFARFNKPRSFQTLHPLADSEKVKFANGSSRTYHNWAILENNASRAETGQMLHEIFELPDPSEVGSLDMASVQPPAPPIEQPGPLGALPAGYPEAPFARHESNYMFGYMLNSTEHRDVCVLVMKAFLAEKEDVNEDLPITRSFIRSFIKGCKEKGGKRLVIDVQDNGGGLVFSGHDVYRHLFPNSDNWSGQRFRSTSFMRHLAKVIPDDENFFFGGILRPNGSRFDSFLSFLGPSKTVSDDTVSELAVWDFANPLTAVGNNESNLTFVVSGYDPKYSDAPKEAPFRAEDIIIATNGHCGSTCATFLRLMTVESGVRTVAFGGRPQEAPMQAVGSTKGSSVCPMLGLAGLGSAVVNESSGAPAPPADALVLPAAPPPLQPVKLRGAYINLRNSYNPGSPEDAPPTQFIYEAAHCRRFVRAEAIYDASAAWEDAAKVAWGGAKCVRGSTVNADGTIGRGGRFNAGTLPYSDAVRGQVKYTGPGAVNGGVAPSGTPPASAGGPGKDGASRKKEDEEEKKKKKQSAAGAARVSWAVMVAANVLGVVVMGAF